MSEFITASETVKKFARDYEGLVKAAELLGKIGSLQQAADEAEARVKAASSKEAESKALLDKLAVQIKDAQSSAEKILADAKGQAAHLNSVTKSLCETAKVKAESDAAVILAMANKDADALKAKAEKEAAEAKAEVSQCAVQKADLVREIAEKQDELNSINAKIEAARRIISQFAA